jgi:aspartyl aminopeptidase
MKSDGYEKLSVEKYGGGIWHTFFDRPLKVAGRLVVEDDGVLKTETVASDYLLTIPSVAIHQNRSVNEGFAINAQVDLCPLLSLVGGEKDYLASLTDKAIVEKDLYLVPADTPYTFGANDEFLASPRIDNLTSVCATLEALFAKADSCGVCVGAFFDHEEIGSRTTQGAAGDFLENTLKRIAYALRFDESEYYKALASSFLLSVDNAHASHPNHPEKGDPTNTCALGKGVVIKSHAGKAYLTDGLSEGVIKTIFRKAGVQYQNFVNRSDVRSGSTLGVPAASALGLQGVDLGLAQLAMHSACESFAKVDYTELVNGLTAFYSTDVTFDDNGFLIR